MERAGFLLQQFRAEGRAILALSDDPKARINALEAGCLDATMSSTPIHELALKIARAVHERRVRRVGTIAAPPLVVDLSARRLVWHGTSIAASGALVDLAACLASRQGQIVPTRVILEEVSGEPWASTDRVHRNVWRLRKTLGLSRDSQFLVARWREGYGIFPDESIREKPARVVRPMDARR
ncbi:MAG: winged helix-turn-helix domain-containing protein [Steroidobacteraceae bacterium]